MSLRALITLTTNRLKIPEATLGVLVTPSLASELFTDYIGFTLLVTASVGSVLSCTYVVIDSKLREAVIF